MEESNQESGASTITEAWLRKHQKIYSQATLHPFILSIRDGTIHFPSFKQWLGQDYIFVRKFIFFLASVLLKSRSDCGDSSDLDVILGGLASMHDEILWFNKEASKWDILLSEITPLKESQDYCGFLESLMHSEVEYAVAVTAFWAIEMVYQASFALCLVDSSKIPPELLETCQRWGNNGFKQYCCSLCRIANRCLEKAPENVVRKAEEAFVHVLENEVGFWSMSHGDS